VISGHRLWRHSATSTADIAASDIPNGVQNGRIADSLAQLRDGQGGAFRSVVTSLSGMVAALGRSADTANSVADSARLDRESITGVNLDEEMANLVSAQRAYEANARVIKAVDDMLSFLMQSFG
jgi:flagellar hook-associated protein 1 FlgK